MVGDGGRDGHKRCGEVQVAKWDEKWDEEKWNEWDESSQPCRSWTHNADADAARMRTPMQ